ncbi:hypothetical protein ACHOLT_18750 [Desulfitobacterium sp. Sab5]|uniref:hypothetical protein n=1 Tax=Desulfitobacterium nosdiversum TaxID=3375356 RepID=UPI003CEBF930
MEKKLCYILGTVFIITSGIIYSLERFIAYFVWIGQMNAHTGSFPTYPNLPGLLTNIFIPIYAVIGIILLVIGYKESNS